jgi:myo-inositol 2-dehydrogenase / D-chiro-inositol 1-dehydrogenase
MDEVPLSLGVVGCGNLAVSRLLPCLHTLPVRLEAVCDTDHARAKDAAGRFGAARVHTSHAELLASAGIDALLVAVGADDHCRIACDAMEAGCAVFTEKPPAATAAEAEQMIATSERTGTICMTGFKKRFAPAYRKAREAIDRGELGNVTLLTIDAASGPYEPLGREFLLDFGIHAIDLARYLGGEVEEVWARGIDDHTYAVSLVFENGGLGVLGLSANRAWHVPTENVELTGTAGSFLTVDNSVELLRYGGGAVTELHRPVFATMAGDSLVETGFQPELAAFVAAARTGVEPESSIRSAHRTMVLYEAIAAAAREHEPVRL